MSLSVVNPSLCHLSPFHQVLCCCFKAILLVGSPMQGIHASLGFWNPCHVFQVPGNGYQSLSVELGFWYPIVGRILHSLRGILDSKNQDSGFFKQNFTGVQTPQAKIYRILEICGFPYKGLSIST